MANYVSVFWQELKQRNVLHALTIYTGAALGLLEAADIFLRYFHFSNAFIYFTIVTAISGFPITLLSAWYLVNTREGIKIRSKTYPKAYGFGSGSYRQEPDVVDDFYNSDRFIRESGSPDNGDKKNYRRKIYRTTAILVIILSITFFLFFSGHPIPFEERDWIVIADFDNLTGEDLFDHSLNTAFVLSIKQSRRINVIPRKRMFDALKRMKKKDFRHIDEETAREIAVREGVHVCISPGISRVGSQYILTAKILEAETGEVMRSELLYANVKDEIIGKLDQLSSRIRRSLGESRYAIGQNKSLPKVTTSSLDALKQFALGHDNLIHLDFEEAKFHYENAIGIDSNFTAAKAALGTLLFEQFEKEQGRLWLEKAMRSLNDLTDIERYKILAFYTAYIEGDMEKAMQYEKMLTELYPDVAAHHHNLGFLFQCEGDFERAIDQYREAVRIDPHFMLSYIGITWIFSSLTGQMDSTLVWSKKMIEYEPDNPWGHLRLGCAYVGMDSLEKAEQAFLKARKLDPKQSWSHYNLAHVYRLMGHYEKAIEVMEEFQSVAPQITTTDYVLGILYRLKGDEEVSRNHFLEYKKQTEWWINNAPDYPMSFTYHGMVLTYLGDTISGWETGKNAMEIDSSAKTHLNFAEFLAIQDKKDEALDHLEKALRKGYRDLVWIRLSPDLYVLHNEERYHMLIQRYFN